MASVRRVRRIVRKIDPWTVLKVSFVFYAVLALGLVLGLIIFWAFVNQAGYPNTVESLLADLGLWDVGESPTVPEGDYLFRAVAFLGVAWAVLMTGLTTLSAVMYNLISDMVGGVEFVVLEEVLASPSAAQPTALPVRQVQSWQTAPPQSKSAQSESTPSESAQPKSTQSESAQPKSAQPKSAQPKSAQSESTQSESAQPKSTQSKSATPGTDGKSAEEPSVGTRL